MSLYRPHLLNLSKILIKNLRPVQIIENRNIKRWVAPTLRELQRRRDKVGAEPVKPRSTYLEWNYDSELFAFGKRLGEEFDPELLKQALTHRSYINVKESEARDKGVEPPFAPATNEALITKGESLIIECIQKEYENKYPPDVISALLDHLTSEEMLSHVGRHLGLTDLILTAEFPVENSSIVATFKAVVAALNQSQDSDRSYSFIKDFLICQLNGKDINDIWAPDKPLEYLKTLLNAKEIADFEPRLCSQSAVNTILANYQVGLYSNKKLLGIGWGESIEIAKETAALNAIHRIQQERFNKTSFN